MIAFHTDLDNTLIYSYKHDIGPRKRNVELYQGREISYITEETYHLLQLVKNEMLIVPTTTRTLEQYQRIDLGIGPFPYALVCNGGVLLINGVPDEAWYQDSLHLVSDSREEMNLAMELLEREPRRKFELRYIEKLFIFTKCNDPETVVNDLKTSLDTKYVDVFSNGEKVYVVYANIGYNSPPRMKEVIITKVGRKYVTVKGLESYSSEYCYDDDSNVFRPKENYDISTLLYSSKNSAEEEIKRLQLKPKISTIIQYKIGSFSTEDIKAIYEIVKKYEKSKN